VSEARAGGREGGREIGEGEGRKGTWWLPHTVCMSRSKGGVIPSTAIFGKASPIIPAKWLCSKAGPLSSDTDMKCVLGT